MEWFSQQFPRLVLWFAFGIVVAISPVLIICGNRLAQESWDAAVVEFMGILRHGELLLVITAILADVVGRLVQDLVVKRQAARTSLRVNTQLSVAVLAGFVAVGCVGEYIKIFSNLHAEPPQPLNISFVVHSSVTFLVLAFISGFIGILITED